MNASGQNFFQLVELMARLRGPEGCPWDRAQDYDSVKGLMLEEAYEVVDAVNARDFDNLQEELGDLLFQVVFYSRLAEEENRFTVEDVTRKLHDKLVRRHPHVFGERRARDAKEALESWTRVKQSEKQAEGARGAGETEGRNSPVEGVQEKSILDGMAHSLPALLEAHEIGNRAAGAGFDWPDIQSLLDKVEEEIHELRAELDGPKPPESGRVEGEIGDLLFAVANVARFLRSDPESCLRRANQKFTLRFKAMEARAAERGDSIPKMDAARLDGLWNEVKRAEAR